MKKTTPLSFRPCRHHVFFRLYDLIWQLAIPFLRHNPRLADGFEARILKKNLPGNVDVWIQSASVGESFLACELVKELERERRLRILLTTNTRQGMDILKAFAADAAQRSPHIALTVTYFPFDRPGFMHKAVQTLRPAATVFLETEIWPGLLAALKTQGSRILLINGRLSPGSLKRYRLAGSIWQTLKPDDILAVSESDAGRFATLFGIPCVDVMPNIKFDRCQATLPDGNGPAAIKALLPPDAPFVVLASVRKDEEPDIRKMILRIRSRYPTAVLALVPRHHHRIDRWRQALNHMRLPWRMRSQSTLPVPRGTVLLWDTFGELPALYACASAAFVGGSLAPLGGHNFLEALFAGIIPVTGPYWHHFRWVGRQIISSGLLQVASGWQEAADMLCIDIESAPSREIVRQKALRYIENRRGGALQACRLIRNHLNEKT